MDKLPKIALARLKATRGAFNVSGSAPQPEAFQGAEHPDANLLAAFVENAVTEAERNQMVSHLARCADCREIAAFAAPAEETTQPVLASTTPRWRPGLVLRWAVLAAAVAAMAVVVVLHRDGWKKAREISKVIPPPAPVGSVGTAGISPAPSPSPRLGKAVAAGPPQNQPPAAIVQSVEPERIPAPSQRLVRPLAKPQETVMDSVRPPETLRAANVTAAKVAPPPSPALGGVPLFSPAAAAPSTEPAGASGSSGNAAARATSPTPGSPQKAVAGKTASAFGVGAQAAFHVSAAASRMQASPMKAAPAGVQTAALWSISSDAKVQRSIDGGNTFQALEVANEVRFRTVAALGSEVWAGGTAGALFHSVDSGATWGRVNIDTGGSTVTEEISGIRLHDPRQLTITTTSGSQWASEDGGQHWHQHP